MWKYNNKLYHYGVPGMKWGHQKTTSSTNNSKKTSSLNIAKNRYWKDSDKKEFKKRYESLTDNDTIELGKWTGSKYTTYTKKTKDYLKEFYGDKYVKKALKTKSENADKVIKEMNTALQPHLDKLKKTKYASKEWFEERKKYYDAMDSYGEKYAKGVLKDLNTTLKAKDVKEFSNWVGVGEGYLNTHSDYRWIANPVTGERDYDLENNKWNR